jgi:hypothetical protein
MTICQAWYDSLEAIPEALRDEFEQSGARWRLKADAIPGASELLNPGLAANRDRALTQYTNEQQKSQRLEADLSQAQTELNNIRQPGAVVLSGDDAKAWEAYTKLGTPKELKKIAEELPELKARVEGQALTQSLQEIAETTGLNHEVLSEWATGKKGEGVTFLTKDGEGGAKVPYVKIEAKGDDGKVTVQEHELTAYAEEHLPGWMFTALTTAEDGKTVERQAAQQKPMGVLLPNLGKATGKPAPAEKKERPADRFQKQRDAVPSPFAPKAPAAGQ